MGFLRQGYESGLPFPSPGDLLNPETEPTSPALAGRFFTMEPPGKPLYLIFSVPREQLSMQRRYDIYDIYEVCMHRLHRRKRRVFQIQTVIDEDED